MLIRLNSFRHKPLTKILVFHNCLLHQSKLFLNRKFYWKYNFLFSIKFVFTHVYQLQCQTELLAKNFFSQRLVTSVYAISAKSSVKNIHMIFLSRFWFLWLFICLRFVSTVDKILLFTMAGNTGPGFPVSNSIKNMNIICF